MVLPASAQRPMVYSSMKSLFAQVIKDAVTPTLSQKTKHKKPKPNTKNPN
jgi:hypothetical protein